MNEEIVNTGASNLPKEIFFPEESLERIKKMDSRGKKEALDEWKEKYAEQKENLALFQEELIDRIRQNPEMHFDNQKFIREKTIGLGLTPDQETTFKDIFSLYMQKHNEVVSIKEDHPNDAKLFEFMFKTKPIGKVEIIEGPMTLYFRCFDPKDYALIYNQSFLNNRELSEHDLNTANMSLGVSISKSPIKELEGCIIAENSFMLNKQQLKTGIITHDMDEGLILFRSNKTRIHEEQHAIKRLFSETRFRQNMYKELNSATSEKEQEIWLSNYLRYIRESIAEPRAKDEILAYFKENMQPEYVVRFLTETKKDGGLYDYLDEGPGMWPVKLQKKLENDEFNTLYEKARDKIFVEEYHTLIENSVRNTQFLESKGYTKDQVIALLINEPLSKWAKVVGRLVEGKKIASEKKKG